MDIQNLYFVISFIFVCFNIVTATEANVAKAEVQSCSGCQLRSLPEVKAFIFDDVPKYDNVVFKHIQGHPPELVLFSDKYEEVDRIPLKDFSREECNKLLTDNGFYHKDESSDKKEL